MNANEKLLEAIGNIDPDLVRAAQSMGRKPRRGGHRLIAVLAAAALTLALGTAAFAYFSSEGLKGFFAQWSESTLTAEQEAYIDEAAVTGGASDTHNGWTVALTSAIADRYHCIIEVQITPPLGLKANLDWGDFAFGRWNLLEPDGTDIAGYDRRLRGGSFVNFLDNGDDQSGTISAFLVSHVAMREENFSYTGGGTRTLVLKDIYGPGGTLLCKGEWRLDIVLTETEESPVELIDAPVTAQGVLMETEEDTGWTKPNGEYADIIVTTFRLTNLGADVHFEWTENGENIVYDGDSDYLNPTPELPEVLIVMKDKTIVEARSTGGYITAEPNSEGYYAYDEQLVFTAPIVLDQVECVRLADGTVLPMA